MFVDVAHQCASAFSKSAKETEQYVKYALKVNNIDT